MFGYGDSSPANHANLSLDRQIYAVICRFCYQVALSANFLLCKLTRYYSSSLNLVPDSGPNRSVYGCWDIGLSQRPQIQQPIPVTFHRDPAAMPPVYPDGPLRP
jgi:hypothetical protein